MNGQSSDKTKHTDRTLNTQVRAVTTQQHWLPCVQAEADVFSLVRHVHSMCVCELHTVPHMEVIV